MYVLKIKSMYECIHTLQTSVVQGSTALVGRVMDHHLGKDLASQKSMWVGSQVPGSWTEPRDLAQPEGVSQASISKRFDGLTQFPARLIGLLSSLLGFLYCHNKF